MPILNIQGTIRLTNEAGVQFLLTDLELAETFLAVAYSTRDPETVHRNARNARTAYDAVVSLLPRLHLTVAQRRTIDRHLCSLRLDLGVLGEKF